MSELKKSFLPNDGETIIQMEIERLKTFKDHPFKVQDDAELLAKVLANPEMAALLTSLAKTMSGKL